MFSCVMNFLIASSLCPTRQTDRLIEKIAVSERTFENQTSSQVIRSQPLLRLNPDLLGSF